MINNVKITNFKAYPQIAGLMPNDSNLEFIGVRKTKQVLWMQNGNNHYFSDLPLYYYTLLKNAYLKDHTAIAFLSEVSDKLRTQVELYTYYMYGSLDATPDIKNGKLAPSENFRDSRNCPSLLWDSKNINIKSHIFTPRQLVIVDFIADNLPDKAIAAALGVTTKTLDFHKSRLFRALGVTTKTELLYLSIQYKIIA